MQHQHKVYEFCLALPDFSQHPVTCHYFRTF